MSDRPPATSRILLPSPNGGTVLAVHVGGASMGAPSKANEDFYGVAAPPEAGERGAVLAIADGISAGGDGRAAAEMTVRSLLSDYYATPADWNASRALDRLLESANDWLASENRRRPANGGIVAALSVLVLYPTHYCVAHVGDTRDCRHGKQERVRNHHEAPWTLHSCPLVRMMLAHNGWSRKARGPAGRDAFPRPARRSACRPARSRCRRAR